MGGKQDLTTTDDALRIPEFLREFELRLSSDPPSVTFQQIHSEWKKLEDYLADDSTGSGPGVTTLIVNDATRPASGPMLKPLEEILRGPVRVLFATGTHRNVTAEEKDELLQGCFPASEWRSNDCDSRDMVDIGTTSRGTRVLLHPWLFDGGRIIAVNSVEPHYFAGFTGGRKSFLPGVSARKTIVQNHYHACLPGSQPGRLEGNPVHEDMHEALTLLEERVRLVQGNGVMHKGRIVGFFAGECRDSFRQASELSSRLTGLPVGRRYDLVVLHPGRPLHINLYQSEKAIYNCNHIVDDGGTLLLVSPCPEGLGADHMEEAFVKSMRDDWIPPSKDDYRLGDHAIVRLKQMRRRIRIALASGLPDKLVRRMGMEPVSDLGSWIRERSSGSTAFIPSAGFIVPYMDPS